MQSSWCNQLIVMLKRKLGVNLEVKLRVRSKTGSKNSILAFLTWTDGSVLAFLKCMYGSVLVFRPIRIRPCYYARKALKCPIWNRMHILIIPLLPLHLLLLINILFFLIPILLLLPYFRRFGRPPGLPLSPTGTCRTGSGMSEYMPGLRLPSGSKIKTGLKLFTSYKIMTGITRFWFSDVCYPDKTSKTNIKTEKELKNQI